MITEEAKVGCMQAAGRIQKLENLQNLSPPKSNICSCFACTTKVLEGEKLLGSKLSAADSENQNQKIKKDLPPELEVCCKRYAIPPP